MSGLLGHTKQSPHSRLIVACSAVCLAVACVLIAGTAWNIGSRDVDGSDELLLKLHLSAHEPYSAPSNLYLWWGPETNHRFVGSGERIRQLLHMGNIEGGEWRDPMFLGNNGVETFESSRFRRISESCCSTILIPPMEWEFPVFNVHNIIGQRIRNFVANGNIMVLTGGIPAIEFINSYFFYTMELADGNYSPGPFRRLPNAPKQMIDTPTVLPQKGVAVTAVKKESLPSGTQVLWGTPRSSPVFMIEFCEAESPDEGMPPVKVLPRDCPQSAATGRPCSCGHIIYIGYNYNEQYPSRWDKVLLSSVEILNPAWKAPGSIKKQVDEPVLPDQLPKALPPPPAQNKQTNSAGQQALKAVAKESTVIDKLEAALKTLDEHEQRQQQLRQQPTAAAATPSLAQQPLSVLEERAQRLVREIDAAKDAGRRRRAAHRRSHRLSREDRLMQHSLIALSHDVEKIDGKVDTLAKVVAHVESAAPAAAAPHPAAVVAPQAQAAPAAAAAAAAAPAADPQQVKALERKLAREQRDKARLAKQAAAYQKELAYEQSMPTPEYSYDEPDHTTPLFGPGGVRRRAAAPHGKAAAEVGCGTMCRLKKLVQKTRSRIDKELQAAMH